MADLILLGSLEVFFVAASFFKKQSNYIASLNVSKTLLLKAFVFWLFVPGATAILAAYFAANRRSLGFTR